MERCTICHTLIRAEDATQTCAECSQTYHAECWRDLGGCATYGCTRAAEAQKPELPTQFTGGWGDSKQCPACGAQLASGLLVCRCGARFPYADPMSRSEYAAHVEKLRVGRRLSLTVLALFLASLTGVFAPLAGPAAAFVAWRSRARLGGADGTYVAMGIGAAALGGVYLLTGLLAFLGL